ASYVAAVLGAEAIVTTAAERLGLPALDEALAGLDWRPEEPRELARLEAAVINGEPIGLYAPGLTLPSPLPTPRDPRISRGPRIAGEGQGEGVQFRPVNSLADGASYPTGLAVSDHLLDQLPTGWTLARPGRLVLGFGCSTDAGPEEAVELALTALLEAGLSPGGVRRLATVDRRRDHPATVRLADALGVETVAFSPAELDAVPVPNGS